MTNSRNRLGNQAKRVTERPAGTGRCRKGHRPGETRAVRKRSPNTISRAATRCSARIAIGQRIREMPVLSVLIAAGAGLLFGVLWTIRRR